MSRLKMGISGQTLDNLLSGSATLLFGVCAVFTAILAFNSNGPLYSLFQQYSSWWKNTSKLSGINGCFERTPIFQSLAAVFFIFVSLALERPWLLIFALLSSLLPPLLLIRAQKARNEAFETNLDGFLTALADSLTTVPNLTAAFDTLVPNIDEPMKSEVETMLYEIKLGRTIEDALTNMAKRLNVAAMDAAVSAALLGKRTGGDLPSILRRIASTHREMMRLEGVVKTKTAEGRSQAWVMGSVPLVLILILEKINPDWLAPMWVDPIGWIMLGGAALLEVIAILLIRKIMAVEI